MKPVFQKNKYAVIVSSKNNRDVPKEWSLNTDQIYKIL